MATARDSMIEIAGENGSPFVARVDIDNHSGKQEAVYFDAEGEPKAGPKVREYDSLILKTFPPLDVYLASFFASQTGVGSVLKMERSDRRALFGRLLGLERLELMATAAREKARKTETDMAAARAALEAVRIGVDDVAALEACLEQAKGKEARAAEAVRDADARLKAANEERDRLTVSAAEYERAEKAYQEARRRAEAAAEALARLEAQARDLEPILRNAKAVRENAERIRVTEANVAVLEGEARAAGEEVRRLEARAAEAIKRFTGASEAEGELRAKLGALEAIRGEAKEIRLATHELKMMSEGMDEARAAGELAAADERADQDRASEKARILEAAERAEHEASQALAAAGARAADAELRRAAAERSTSGVPCAGVLEDASRAGCPALVGHFRTRDEAIKALAEYGENVAALTAAEKAAEEASKAARAKHAEAEEKLDATQKQVNKLRAEYIEYRDVVLKLKAADRTAQLERAEAEAGALEDSLKAAVKAANVADDDRLEAFRDRSLAQEAADEKQQNLASLRARLTDLKSRDGLSALEAAERTAAELEGRIVGARESVKDLTAEASRLKAERFAVDTELVRAAVQAALLAGEAREGALQEAQEARGQVAGLEVKAGTARDAKAKADALVEKLAPMEKDLSEWRWLGRGLGREGVQALELDAAGPRVAELANELLADAYGPRFQIRFETQAAMANGKGVKETFDIIVVDTEKGREGNGEDLSGGEKVIVGEALGLAVGLFHAQAAGVTLGTVIRDETVGALDPENGERYLAMLRAFLRVGHVHQLLYVAHQPALVEMADAVVRIEDGLIKLS